MKNLPRKTLGLLYLIAGLVIILLSLGELLVRLAIGLFALYLINKGLHLRNMPTLQSQAYTLFMRRRFF